MYTYIALLRGINVSGHNKIKMTELKELLQTLELTNIKTYIQSGNVLFTSGSSNSKLIEDQIVLKIKESLGYSIKVLVLTIKEIESIFNMNPFLKVNPNVDIKNLYVTLLDKIPLQEFVPSLNEYSSANEKFKIDKKTVYLHFPNGYGKTKLSTNLIEKRLHCEATSRNWKTITKLVELSRHYSE